MDALAMLYTENAVLTSTGGPSGEQWAVGRDQVLTNLNSALQSYTVLDERPPITTFSMRGDDLAARYGTFVSVVQPKTGGQEMTLTVDAFEVLGFSATTGWQYLADQSRVVSITTPQVGLT